MQYAAPVIASAIKDGTLKPVGRTRKFKGMMSYIFRTVDLIRFCRIPEYRTRAVANDVPLSLKQAAGMLDISERSVSELSRLGELKYFVGHRSRGWFALVSKKSVDAFSMKFIRAHQVAEQLRAGNTNFTKVLREHNIPVVRFSWGLVFVRRTVWEQKLKKNASQLKAA